ncbi:hypothetical protein ADK86_08855 [Streptomyces sp. NRRL F-5755]|nr:hypothetical protein ADK86_08855 [Streptomyces sp. NRRL F-5755]
MLLWRGHARAGHDASRGAGRARAAPASSWFPGTDTVEQPVPFVDSRYARTLTSEQRRRLLAAHPEGRARFWGAVPSHDKKMRDVAPDDVVLFTGGNRVRAVGEIGVIFRNRELADLLWPPPDESAPSWHTVYTLLDLTDTDIPYHDLNAALGYKPTHVFPGQMVFSEDRARPVLEELMITSSAEQVGAAEPARRPDSASRAAVRTAAAEQNRTFGTAYERTGRLIVVAPEGSPAGRRLQGPSRLHGPEGRRPSLLPVRRQRSVPLGRRGHRGHGGQERHVAPVRAAGSRPAAGLRPAQPPAPRPAERPLPGPRRARRPSAAPPLRHRLHRARRVGRLRACGGAGGAEGSDALRLRLRNRPAPPSHGWNQALRWVALPSKECDPSAFVQVRAGSV